MRFSRVFAWVVVRSALAAAFATAAIATSATAQVKRTVDGRVVRPIPPPPKTAGGKDTDSLGLANVPNVMVTLHRVNRGGQGSPLDSTRTNVSGQYHFAYNAPDTLDAIYFTSVTYGGIAYFTAPLRNAKTVEHDGEITVFDTTSRAVPLTVAGRHLIVSAADTSTNERTIVEVFELSNDSILTVVSQGTGKAAKPTWVVTVPAAARKFKAGEGGDISPDAVTFDNGRVSVFAPMAPGVKQLSFSYHLPTKSFPLAYTVDHGATVLEVLLEEALGTATGAGLVAADPVALQNRNFRRFLAQNVADGAVVNLVLPSGPSVGRNLYIAALLGTIGVLMLLILLRAMQRRQPITYGGPIITTARAVEAPLADRLAREIADLDATFARHENPNDALRNAYNARRAELKDALAAESARR
jgi:hypothetical protein